MSKMIDVSYLWDFQAESSELLKQGLLAGHNRQILCSPTGSGKTVVAGFMTAEAVRKKSRVVFVVDRLTLVDQTSKRFLEFGINHGVIQAGNSMGRGQSVQVCSAQTLEKRGYWPPADLIFIDEAHDQREKIQRYIIDTGIPTVGLTATPFTVGLADVYSNVINVRTTNQLIAEGRLAPPKIFSGTEMDMRGAKLSGGEWLGTDIRKRSAQIVGDIITEFEDKTRLYFGDPRKVKTIVFSASVDHGADLCKDFAEAGYNFQQISYKMRDRSLRRQIIEDFEKGKINGLVSVDALCLDSETEILTSDGWVGIDEISYSHKVANWHKNSSITFKEPANIVKRSLKPEEKMVRYDGAYTQFRVTGNHRMVHRSKYNVESWKESHAIDLLGKKFVVPSNGIAEADRSAASKQAEYQKSPRQNHTRRMSFHRKLARRWTRGIVRRRRFLRDFEVIRQRG